MKPHHLKSLSPENKNSNPTLNFSQVKMPSISFGYFHKSVQRIRQDLHDKIDYEKTLQRLDISPVPNKYRNPFKASPEPLFKNPQKQGKFLRDSDLEEFIDAMFFNVNNGYRLFIQDMAAPIDYFNSELQIKNLKKLKPIIRGIEAEEVDKTPLEEFWIRNISSSIAVRWDLFEEALCRHFLLNINTSIGRVRKINWDLLLKKLLKHISAKSVEVELWPGHPGLVSIEHPGLVVSLSNFQKSITSGKFQKLVRKSITNDTFYLGEKYKNQTFTFACGAKYRGAWKNFKKDGLGLLVLTESFTFEGYFFKGFRHGYGLCKGLKCEYKGYWDKDLFDGPGEINYFDLSAINGIWKSGNVISGKLKFSGGEYTGYFNKLFFEGSGILINKIGDIKKGTWVKGKLNGDCEVFLKNGSVYKGKFENDFLQGTGLIDTLEFTYNGEVKNSLPDGQGKIIYKIQSAEYEGGFVEGVIDGKGVYKTESVTLKGEFVHGKLTGKGEKTFEIGCKYIGEFSDSLMHGKGTLRFFFESLKGFYTGDLRLNKFHGFGKLKINSAEYKGELAHGEMHGNGELILEKIVYRGSFFKGELIGRGIVRFYDGSHYDGEWGEGKPNGSGEALDTNGYWIASNFVDGNPASRHRLSPSYFENIEGFMKKRLEFAICMQGIIEKVSIL